MTGRAIAHPVGRFARGGVSRISTPGGPGRQAPQRSAISYDFASCPRGRHGGGGGRRRCRVAPSSHRARWRTSGTAAARSLTATRPHVGPERRSTYQAADGQRARSEPLACTAAPSSAAQSPPSRNRLGMALRIRRCCRSCRSPRMPRRRCGAPGRVASNTAPRSRLTPSRSPACKPRGIWSARSLDGRQPPLPERSESRRYRPRTMRLFRCGRR